MNSWCVLLNYYPLLWPGSYARKLMSLFHFVCRNVACWLHSLLCSAWTHVRAEGPAVQSCGLQDWVGSGSELVGLQAHGTVGWAVLVECHPVHGSMQPYPHVWHLGFLPWAAFSISYNLMSCLRTAEFQPSCKTKLSVFWVAGENLETQGQLSKCQPLVTCNFTTLNTLQKITLLRPVWVVLCVPLHLPGK